MLGLIMGIIAGLLALIVIATGIFAYYMYNKSESSLTSNNEPGETDSTSSATGADNTYSFFRTKAQSELPTSDRNTMNLLVYGISTTPSIRNIDLQVDQHYGDSSQVVPETVNPVSRITY